MSAKVDSIFEAAMQLSDDERAELCDLLFHTVPPERQEEIDKAWADEVERRAQELRDGKVKAVAWDEVRESLVNRSEK